MRARSRQASSRTWGRWWSGSRPRAPRAANATAGPARVKLELGPGIAERVAPETSRAAYRIVSEALTNVRRHAPDVSRVQVSVGGSPTALAIAVANDGVAGDPTPARRGGGSGLSELREHSEALGGTLEAGPDGHGGWRLDAVLPT